MVSKQWPDWVYHLNNWSRKRHIVEEQYWISKYIHLATLEYAELVASELLHCTSPHTMIVVGWDLQIPYNSPIEPGRHQFLVPNPRIQLYNAIADRFGLIASHTVGEESYLCLDSYPPKPHAPNIVLSDNPIHAIYKVG